MGWVGCGNEDEGRRRAYYVVGCGMIITALEVRVPLEMVFKLQLMYGWCEFRGCLRRYGSFRMCYTGSRGEETPNGC